MTLSRRGLLKTALAAGIAPMMIPASVLRGAAAPSNQITLGVIGAGAQGGEVDMRAFLLHKDVRVRAICDVNQRNIDRARGRIREAYGSDDVKVFSDFRELNRSGDIDAVLMALPVHWHSIPAVDAILNGKHIYHEKPMGMSFAEAQMVRRAVAKTGVVFQFGTQQRSNLQFRWASELALNGRLGRISEIQVSVPAGAKHAPFEPQPVPDYVDWDRWVGPAPMTPFHELKLRRNWHENLSNFSLGMISCWGIHHLDIAQWGNGTDATGPINIEGGGAFPEPGDGCDAVLSWKVRFEYAQAAPITFVSEDTPGYQHGVRFIGDRGHVHVKRGSITASEQSILRDPAGKVGQMPVKLPESVEHTRNFVDAVKNKTRAICDIQTAVRSDTLSQLAIIAVKTGRKLRWDPAAERIIGDDGAGAMLQPRAIRGDWKLPTV